MPVFPRTDAFGAFAGSLPTDGGLYVLGQLGATSDPGANALGSLSRYGARDAGTVYAVSGTDAQACAATRDATTATNTRTAARLHWTHVTGGTRQDVVCGVAARIQSITGTATSPDRWWAASGYAFEAAIDASAETAVWTLKRYDAGVATTLATSAALAWAHRATKRVELRVYTTTGGAAVLLGLVDGDLVAYKVDPMSSALAGPGRAGWITSSAKQAGGETRASARDFRVSDQATDTAELEDDFDRPNRTVDTADDYLRALWTPATLLPVTSGAVAYATFDGTAAVALRQIRPYVADYRVDVDHTVPIDSQENFAGLVVRGQLSSAAGDLAGFTGYVARCSLYAADEVEILKVVDGTVRETVTAGITGQVLSQNWTLRVDVAGTDTVTVAVRVNGILTATLTDKDPDRIREKGLAGLYFFGHASGSGTIAADNFILNDGSAPAAATALDVPDESYPADSTRTVVVGEDLSSQLDGATATLALAGAPRTAAETAVRLDGGFLERVASTPSASQYSVDTGAPSITLGVTPAATSRVFIDYVKTGDTSVVMGEAPVGAKNGVNKAFQIANVATGKGQLRLRHNGARLAYVTGTPGVNEYAQRTSNIILLGLAPASGDDLRVDYVKQSADVRLPVFGEIPPEAPDGSRRTFTLEHAPSTLAGLHVTLSGFGMQQTASAPSTSEFTLVGRTVTLGDSPAATDDVTFDYIPAGLYDDALVDVPDLPVSAIETFAGVVHQSEYGYRQGFPLQSTPRTVWPCVFGGRTKAQADVLSAFFEAKVGAERSFAWTPPDEDEAVLVHVRPGSIRRVKIAPDIYDVAVELVSVIALSARAA